MKRDEAKVRGRARAIAEAGSIAAAVAAGRIPQFDDVTASEALVLGLLNQGVRKYVGVFGHGSTDIARILSLYEEQSLVRMWNVRNEVAAAHAATMLRWQYGETAAVVTSIGPGALHAFAGSLVDASNGIGVYHVYGDETTHDEGPNMQQVPKDVQGSFLTLASTMGRAYQLAVPEAIFAGLRWGAATVFHPTAAGPFTFLMPMNVQPQTIRECNLLEFPERPSYPPVAAAGDEAFARATALARRASAVAIKLGGGARHCGAEVRELARLLDAVIVAGAGTPGVVPPDDERYVSVGGSKGSPCGNWAMNNADLVVVVGARAVCQWDCSGTAFQKARGIVNFNADPLHASHYNRSVPVVGDARCNLARWIEHLKREGFAERAGASAWLSANTANRRRWEEFRQARYDHPVLRDETWGREVLTQPAAIRIACDVAEARGAARYFDAGDVQANGFQIVEDREPGHTFSDTGSSYMGFAVSSLLAGAMADRPRYAFAVTGDGSFTMNPQILIDGVEHGVRGCIVLLDNRRMAAITGLQVAQYGAEYRTADRVAVDYVALARAVRGVKGIHGGYDPASLRRALEEACDYDGLSLVHVPVYAGDDELGGLGAYGAWNVGSWCEQTQALHHRLGL